MPAFLPADVRAYVITATDGPNRTERHMGNGAPLVILAPWYVNPADILADWLTKRCADSTRDALRAVCVIRPADSLYYQDEP